MNLTIHRGTHEIGGSCIALESQGKRLILDIGLPLVNPDGTPFDQEVGSRSHDDLIADGVLPPVPGLYDEGDDSVVGVILSHTHQDHTGLASFASSTIPVYMSRGTKTLLDVSEIFLPNPTHIKNAKIIETCWEPFNVGPFTVEAYPMDHSSPGAIAVVVESDGQRIFYTGDFRAHGRREKMFKNILKRPPREIDFLLMEGSTFGRKEGEYTFPTEESVELAFAEAIKDAKNLSMIFCAGQNLDRVVSAYKAALRTGKTLVVDLYTAYLLEQLHYMSDRLPHFQSDHLKVKYYKHHMSKLDNAGLEPFMKKIGYSHNGIDWNRIGKDPSQYVFLARSNGLLSSVPDNLPSHKNLVLIWSMWKGYLTGNDPFSRFCENFGYTESYLHIHTSGHATIEDLSRLVDAVKPKQIVPIHTFHPEAYVDFNAPVLQLQDGEEYPLQINAIATHPHLPPLTPELLNLIFDCVYGNLTGRDNISPEHLTMVEESPMLDSFIEMLLGMQRHYAWYAHESTVELLPLFEDTIGSFELNSEGTTMWLAMGMVVMDLYCMDKRKLKLALSKVTIRK